MTNHERLSALFQSLGYIEMRDFAGYIADCANQYVSDGGHDPQVMDADYIATLLICWAEENAAEFEE